MSLHNKPDIVLVGGGWHVPESYSKLTDALKAAGYTVHVPFLPSMNNSRPPNANLATDTGVVRELVEQLIEEGTYAVVIMHSYGGQVGTNALVGLGTDSRVKKGKQGGVKHLIYMAASVLPEGDSMITKVKEFGHEHLMPVAFDFADDNTCVCRDPKTILIGSGMSDEEADKYVSTFRLFNGKAMYEPISNSAWREIPLTYIFATEDMTLPYSYQQSMVENVRKEGFKVETVELSTGHCPNLTKTKEVVDVVNDVVEKTVRS
ncbi:alpha/beta-hydrolase [Viridothelium virens]|uniref:Alpha/beta-hydrolase n=1 Tax=Viridothelium virens TaxID=1048519 RepID=A0A6A6H5S3_VIRVR|nr:alpha/beta-hydrolase [Viridothelium virens]